MQKVYKDIHKKILQIIQCKCINWDVTDSRSSLVLSSLGLQSYKVGLHRYDM